MGKYGDSRERWFLAEDTWDFEEVLRLEVQFSKDVTYGEENQDYSRVSNSYNSLMTLIMKLVQKFPTNTDYLILGARHCFAGAMELREIYDQCWHGFVEPTLALDPFHVSGLYYKSKFMEILWKRSEGASGVTKDQVREAKVKFRDAVDFDFGTEIWKKWLEGGEKEEH